MLLGGPCFQKLQLGKKIFSSGETNVLLELAYEASELRGMVAVLFRRGCQPENCELGIEGGRRGFGDLFIGSDCLVFLAGALVMPPLKQQSPMGDVLFLSS